MKKKIISLTAFILLGTIGLFYFLKKDQLNNILNPNNTKIEIKQRHFNFGKIKIGDTLKHAFL